MSLLIMMSLIVVDLLVVHLQVIEDVLLSLGLFSSASTVPQLTRAAQSLPPGMINCNIMMEYNIYLS